MPVASVLSRPEATVRVLPRLIGTVVEMPNGYGFINNITTIEGEQFDTNGDVFVHQDESDFTLTVGAMVEFTLIGDNKREGKFRAIGVSNAVYLPVLQGEAAQLPSLVRRYAYHKRVKAIPAEQVRKAIANKPLKQVIGIELDELVEIQDADDARELVAKFLEETFTGLSTYDVVFDLDAAGSEAEKRSVEMAVSMQSELGFATQASLIESEYALFLSTIAVLQNLRQVGVLSPGSRMSISALHMLVGSPSSLNIRRNRTGFGEAGTMEAQLQSSRLFTETVRFLRDAELLQPCSVIPIAHVADLLVAAPVWFIEAKDSLPDTWNQSDPQPDVAVQYFASLLGTQEFANLYQIFNRRTRRLAQYQGDVIPPHILRAIMKAKQHFDYVVIFTPYHDIAGREWQDPAWQALIDPFLFGFKKGVPYMFFIGRWSDTGVFPLMGEMVADTMAFLRANKEKLHGFKDFAYWHNLPGMHVTGQQHNYLGGSERLVNLVDSMLEHFEAGTLFDYLRGELPAETALANQD